MAYSFARSVRENYEIDRDKGMNKRLNESRNESRITSGNEYLDLGFAWLNDIDKDGNYHAPDNNAQNIDDTQKETLYIKRTQSPRHEEQPSGEDDHPPINSGDDLRQSRPAGLRKTGKDGLRMTGKRALRHARRRGYRVSENIDMIDTSTSGHIQTIEDDLRNTSFGKFGDAMNVNSTDGMRIVPSPITIAMDNEMKPTSLRESTDRETETSNTRGMTVLGVSLHPQKFQVGETVEENPHGWIALGATRRPTSKKQNLPSDETIEDNSYGKKALIPSRRPKRKTQNFSVDETVAENSFGWKALGATRHKSSNTQNLPLGKTDEENPHGWKALGATRPQTSDTQHIQLNETIEENPYGWKSLGATRPHPSNDSDYDRTNTTSRKRPFRQTSMSKKRTHTSERDELRSVRKFIRAKRMQALPEESTKEEDVADSHSINANVVIRNTTGNRQSLRETSGGEGLRGTTYDYAYTRNIERESIPEHKSNESINVPERKKISWANQRSPDLRVKRWTDIATDYSAMKKWYEMFVKIKKRWAADYKNPSLLSGLSGNTDFRPGSFTSRSVDKKRQLSGRRKQAVICAVVFLVLLIAVVVPVSILTSADSSEGGNFNETCSTGQSCKSIFSDCINKTCACPVHRFYNLSADECSLISCGDIPDIAHGTSSANDTNYGAVLTIDCDTGFEISVNTTILCSSPSSWATLPSCNKIQCENFAIPEHAIYGNITNKNFTFLDEIVITCEEGFEIIGENKTICQENRTWSNNPVCEPVNCSEPFLHENVVMVTENISYVFESIIEVGCEIGFIIDGGSNISCQANKSWTESPYCRPVTCSVFQFPENTEHKNVTETYSVNNSITIDCLTGFVIHGNDSVVCQPNGNWTELPNCNPVYCQLFNKPNNSVGFNESATFKYLDMVTFDCEVGYKISRNENITCNENGNWSMIPECLKVQCDFYELDNGQAGNQTFYSDNISIECELGYERSSNETVTCLQDGQWSSNVTCELVDCKEYVPPEHALVLNNTSMTVYETNLELQCETGYVLRNENESFISCSSEGVWKGNPECEIIPDLMFTVSKETEQIGNNVELNCILVGNLSDMGVVITRPFHNGSEDVLCNVSDDGTVHCEVTGITVYGSNIDDKMNVTIVIDTVDCNDEGEYLCKSVSSNSLNATISLSVTKSVTEKPKLEMPTRMILNYSETFQNISCQSDVGYPVGELRIEYRTGNSSSFEALMLGEKLVEHSTDGCLVNKTISFSNYTFTELWNNTIVRCALYNDTGDAEPYQVSDDAIIELIENECSSTGSSEQYHPFNCHYYVRCNQGNIEVVDCGSACPVIENSGLTSCNGNCTSLGC